MQNSSSRDNQFELSFDRLPALRDRVYDHLRTAIINGQMAPGATLLQEQLAEQMGVSRTPIRDALDRLASEGLVTRSTGGRVSVAELSFQELNEKYTVRSVLEGLALRLAAERMSAAQLENLGRILHRMRIAVEQNDAITVTEIGADFHDAIIAASGNEYLVQTLQSLNDSIRRYRRVAANIPGRALETMHEHEQIYNALKNREIEAAQELIQQHIAHSQLQLEAAIKAYQQRVAEGDAVDGDNAA